MLFRLSTLRARGGFVSDLTGFIVTRVNRASLHCIALGQSGFCVNLSGLKIFVRVEEIIERSK